MTDCSDFVAGSCSKKRSDNSVITSFHNQTRATCVSKDVLRNWAQKLKG